MDAPMTIAQHTAASYIIRGETKPYKEEIKRLGGRWNRNPSDGEGPGWILGQSRYQAFMSEMGDKVKLIIPAQKEALVGPEPISNLPVVKRSQPKVVSVQTTEISIPARYTHNGVETQLACYSIVLPKTGSQLSDDDGVQFTVKEIDSLLIAKLTLQDEEENEYDAYYLSAKQGWTILGWEKILQPL